MPSASEPFLEEALNFREVHDISAPLGTAPTYPGDKPYSRDWMSKLNEGADYGLSAINLSSHAGTHLDFPSHIHMNGKTLDQYPLKRFIIPDQVVSAEDDEAIYPSALHGLMPGKGEGLLFKTRNSRQELMHQIFSERFVSLSLEAARLCVAMGAGLVGIDYISADKYDDASLSVHHHLLENDVLILEGIDLSNIPCGRYLLICLPLRINDAEASPVRAILAR